MSKICTSCGSAHPLSFFNKDRTKRDGHDPRCKDCTRAACKRVYAENADKHRAMKQAWKDTNRERHREWNREYGRANPEMGAARTRQYSAAKRRATPPWVDRAAIKAFYENCPEGHHVDHIHPLRGRGLSGLNVPWNLQYLPADQHMRKGNRLMEPEEVCYL